MARLIEADALIEHLREYKTVYGVPMTKRDKQMIHYVIGHIKNIEPTAYNVDKVVEELERMRIDESQGCHNVITVKCNGYKNCEDCIFDRATEIVRKGGVE